MHESNRPTGTHLGNWRTRPHNSWAFQNVRELIPTANIAKGKEVRVISSSESGVSLPFEESDLIAELEQLQTDNIVILKSGIKQWQWSTQNCDAAKPHIIFSVGEFVIAIIAGCLRGQNLLDMDKPISHYLTNTTGSGYADCTVQQLLDMQVSLDFTEDYTDPNGDYFHYRNATCWNPIDQTKESPSLEAFLYGIKKGTQPHGETFAYKSPNSDLLGLLVERVAGIPYAELLSETIWKPMGAQSDGYVTVDQAFLARGAGGVCVTIDDLALLGHLVLNQGAIGTRSIIPEAWIHDTCHNGNRQAWLNGEFAGMFPKGNYRNKWYQTGDADKSFCGIGIHGQWLFINPTTEIVIAKLSSQAEPLNEEVDGKVLQLLQRLGRERY